MLRNNSILMITILFIFTGCSFKSYENFKKNKNFTIGSISQPINHKHLRKIYDKDHYIYIHKALKRCIYGYITNKYDKPEKVISWKIISGKEFCKEKRRWAI